MMAKRRKTIPRTAAGKLFPTQEFPLQEDCAPMCMRTPQAIVIFTNLQSHKMRRQELRRIRCGTPPQPERIAVPKPIFWLRSYHSTGANPTTETKRVARTNFTFFLHHSLLQLARESSS